MGVIEDAIAAKQAGISYGEYMKRKGPPPPLVRFEGPGCWECGKPLPKGKRKYCSEACFRARTRKREKWGVFC